jgi:hypothetical protein
MLRMLPTDEASEWSVVWQAQATTSNMHKVANRVWRTLEFYLFRTFTFHELVIPNPCHRILITEC